MKEMNSTECRYIPTYKAYIRNKEMRCRKCGKIITYRSKKDERLLDFAYQTGFFVLFLAFIWIQISEPILAVGEMFLVCVFLVYCLIMYGISITLGEVLLRMKVARFTGVELRNKIRTNNVVVSKNKG